jgi:hypothetical protein
LKKTGALILKKDNLKFGLLLGFLLPILVFILIYFLKFSSYEFGDFFQTFLQESRLITFFSAWCLVANIGLFTLYINTNKFQTAKGVFIITIAYGLGFLLLKLLV